MAPRTVILGAGVIGLSIARSLADRGVRATVLDAAVLAREASWAAGGILGLGTEYAADGPAYRLARWAFDRWGDVAARLARETGIALEVTRTGTLLVAGTPDELRSLEQRGAFHRAVGIGSAMHGGKAALRLEPRLAPATLAALHIPEARLDNRLLLAALEAACRRAGVDVRLGTSVEGLVERGGRVAGVRIAGETVEADAVVVATGAWSAALASAIGFVLPTVPVKGQMIRLDAPDDFLAHVVKRGPQYLVPQRGRGVVVGTTAEEVGFDRRLDEPALARIQAAAAELVPAAATLPRVEAWAGFRPRLPDLLPALGPVRSRPGLYVATGHFRNGILLCEATGELLARAVLGDVDPRLAPFDPERFEPPRPGDPRA